MTRRPRDDTNSNLTGRWNECAKLFLRSQRPWQKDTVENANKRTRRFLPTDTDLTLQPQAILKQWPAFSTINPEKRLSYRIPAEVFAMHLQNDL